MYVVQVFDAHRAQLPVNSKNDRETEGYTAVDYIQSA